MRKRFRQAKKYVARKRKQASRLKNHPFVIPVITFLVLFFAASVGLVALNAQTVGASDSRVVRVFVDGQEQTLPTRASTVGDLLSRLNIATKEGDIVEPAADTPILEDNFRVNVYRAHPVTIIDGAKKMTVMSAHQTPRQIVQTAGIGLSPEDEVTLAEAGEALKDNVLGRQIVINRAVPISVNLYGFRIVVRTAAKTVGAALAGKGIKTLPDDTTVPTPDTPIMPDLQVFVVHVGSQIETVSEVIPYEKEAVEDPNVARGVTVVRQAGRDGQKLVTYEIGQQNGQTVRLRLLQEVLAAEPVKEITARGTKVSLTGAKADWLAGSQINPADYSAVDYIIARESTWRPNAISANKCIGLGQSCGGGLAQACPSWQVDPVCQLNFFDNYAKRRYGTWQKAYNFWTINHWW